MKNGIPPGRIHEVYSGTINRPSIIEMFLNYCKRTGKFDVEGWSVHKLANTGRPEEY